MVYRIAVAGIGKIARDQHLPCIAKNRNFKLVAGVSRNATLEDAPVFESIAALVNSKIKLDCVALCTPPAVRLSMAMTALDAGYHVLIEKPPTPTLSEMLAMIDYAKHKKRVLYATWHSRYNRSVDEAKRLLKGKRVNLLKVTWREDVCHWHPGQEWIWQPGGFGVFDPGINALSIVTKIMPEPIYVQNAVIEVPSNRATPIAAQIAFKYADGRRAEMSADFDWRQKGEQTWNIEIGTEDGMAMALRKGGSVLEMGGKQVLQAPMEEYEMIYARFADLLKSGKSETDIRPLQLECDCFMLGKPVVTAPFEWA
jgi:D-galactose 1-dehydrogenase